MLSKWEGTARARGGAKYSKTARVWDGKSAKEAAKSWQEHPVTEEENLKWSFLHLLRLGSYLLSSAPDTGETTL